MSSYFYYVNTASIKSLEAAIAFAILYVFLLGWFGRKSFTHPTYVHYVLAFFCMIRVTAFAIRAVLAGSESAWWFGLVITDETLFAVGRLFLLYSAYTLVLDRMLLFGLPSPSHRLLRLTQDRRLLRRAVLMAFILEIVASSLTESRFGRIVPTLHIASTGIILILAVLQTFHAFVLVTSGKSGPSQYLVGGEGSAAWMQYSNYIFLISTLLLLMREIDAAVLLRKTNKRPEPFWYPLIAVPEILVVILYITPGLIPRSDEIPSFSLPDSDESEPLIRGNSEQAT